jgi:hypothetical protein
MHPNHPFEVIIPGAEDDTEGIAHTKPHEHFENICQGAKRTIRSSVKTH